MPLLFSKKINPSSGYAVWKINETEDQLLEICHSPPPEMLSSKQSEWMVSRILVKYLSKLFDIDYHGMDSLPSGKPILRDQMAEVSITHSFPYAATMIHLHKPCGIDMELGRPKLRRVQHKFLHETERGYADQLDKLMMIWSAKEVVFKVHGEKNLSFKDEIAIELTSDTAGTGKILKPGIERDISLRFETVHDYCLCYSL